MVGYYFVIQACLLIRKVILAEIAGSVPVLSN